MNQTTFIILLALATLSCNQRHTVYNDPVPEHDSLNLYSKYVNEERVINIWTPPDYQNTDERMQVLYMPDGGIKEDFPHIANTLDALIRQGKIPNTLLVGIENTERQRDLTGPTNVEYDLEHIANPGGSENFRKFITNELFPTINNQYRTTNKRILIGESAAGLFVIETFILDTDMFEAYIAMDPALWYNNQYLVNNFDELTADSTLNNTKLWFAGSSAADINPHTKQLSQKLKSLDGDLVYKYCDEPKEKHNTIFRATKEKALVWSLN